MDKKIKNIIGWIVYIAVLIVLVFGIPKGLAYALKTDYPMAAITSSSMWPSLKTGDLVLIKGVSNPDEIKIGDIIVYRNPMGFTIHRVEKINENTIVTKGDANNVSDLPIAFSEVIGKTINFNSQTVRIPYLGNVSILFNKHI